jgi:hypothetical protein
MMNILLNPHMGVAGNKPYAAVDKCFDDEGQVIAAGADVWDGEWNGRSEGACMQSYPIAKTSREIAGGPLSGDIFKCQLQSVTDAIAKGEYGELNMWPYLERLETVFPEGVCDFSLADLGRPLDLLEPPALVVNDSEPAKHSKPALTTKPEDDEALTLSRLELDASLGDDMAIPVSTPMSIPAPAAGHQDKGLTGR